MPSELKEKRGIAKNPKVTTPFFTFGLGKERDYLVENLSMLISGGMPVMNALESIRSEVRSRRMKNVIARIKADIESGSTLWRTLDNSKLFPTHAVSLIRLGEESGKLVQNLKVVAIEQEKDRVLRSKLRSAMMYPVFVLSLTVVIGVGIAWFILPKLATVFAQLKIRLPLITKILIGAGSFLGIHGQYVVPAIVIVVALLAFFIFSFSKTKFIGQFILFSTPGISSLIKEVELSRFGYLLGTLLQAGLPITRALDSLLSASEVSRYRKLFLHIRNQVEEGNSLQKSLATFKGSKKLISVPIQQLIVAGERSGTLSATLLKIGQNFEAKSDTSTKNLTVILEPVLLVIVWLGVVSVALAVILPIYNLIGGFNGGMGDEVPPPVVEQSVDLAPVASTTPQTITILPSPLGYVNVRSKPATSGEIVTKVLPDQQFEYTSEENNWYQINLPDNQVGWVSGKYAQVSE